MSPSRGRKISGRLALVLGAILGLLPSAAHAHPLSVSYTHAAVHDDRVDVIVRVPLDAMDLLLRLDKDIDGKVSDAELEAGRPAITAYLTKHVVLTAGGRVEPAIGTIGSWVDSERFPYVESHLSYTLPSRYTQWMLQVAVLTDLYKDHRTIARIERGDFSESFLFQHGSTYSARPAPAPLLETGLSFVAFGIEHIFTGYDHIVFLFGLLLVGHGLRNLVFVVTSFTVAHSMTLSVAALGLFEPVPWTIEAAIALSVAYVGIENLFVKDVRHRWKLTFAFGLVHGFGFANVLREMHLPADALVLSLFTFNLGVEIGQVVIVALMWPALKLLERQPARPVVVRVASMAIAAVGLFWFYQRIS
jgi:HupE/UreJ protein/uncharacterized protein DUF6702